MLRIFSPSCSSAFAHPVFWLTSKFNENKGSDVSMWILQVENISGQVCLPPPNIVKLMKPINEKDNERNKEARRTQLAQLHFHRELWMDKNLRY